MRRFFLSIICLSFLGFVSINAQTFTVSPSPVQDSSDNVVITFNADKPDASGATPFKGVTSSTLLYAHIGVYTTKSPATWSHVKADWAINTDPAIKFSYVSANKWTLNIGNLRSYFNTTKAPLAADEKITKICIIARDAKGTTQTKDFFIDVAAEGFAMNFTSDATTTAFTAATAVKFTASATQASTMAITVNGVSIASQANVKSLSASYTFSTAKAYEVKATATAGGKTLTETLNFVYLAPSTQKDYPGGVPKMGAVRQSDGSVVFCLAAPNKKNVVLVPSWDDYKTLDKNQMYYQDYNGARYFWVSVKGLNPDTRYPYYYLVDGTIKVGDPYAHLVLDPYSDKWIENDCGKVFTDRPAYPYDKINEAEGVMLAVYHENQDNYNWTVKNFDIPDSRSMVIYEVCLRDFTGTDYKPDGNLVKAYEKIDYLADLGINAIELMPVMEFNGNNSWGYNTNFYMALDKAYGSPTDLKKFIDRCHQKGIAVILDIVFNQSDGLHPWYKMYPAASNPFYNAVAPHAYNVLNDWKQENALVQQQWKDAITYWMTKYKVDGFRFDLVKGLGDSSSYGTSSEDNTNKYNATRVKNMKRLRDVITSINPKGIHINECLGSDQEENEFAASGQLNWNNQNWMGQAYAKGEKNATSLMYISSQKCTRTKNSAISYVESHDEERIGAAQKTSLGNEQTRMKRLATVAPMLMLVPDATPMIWQFGELGADESIEANGGRVATKKVLWNYLNNANHKMVYDAYKGVANLRTNNPDIFNSDDTQYTNSLITNAAGLIRLRTNDKEIVAFVNSNANQSTVKVTLADLANSYQIIAQTPDVNPALGATKSVNMVLPAHSYIVIASDKVNVSAIESVGGDDNATNVSIWAEPGKINIEGEYQRANIYNQQGMDVTNVSNLSSDIYHVRIDGKTTKIFVP